MNASSALSNNKYKMNKMYKIVSVQRNAKKGLWDEENEQTGGCGSGRRRVGSNRAASNPNANVFIPCWCAGDSQLQGPPCKQKWATHRGLSAVAVCSRNSTGPPKSVPVATLGSVVVLTKPGSLSARRRCRTPPYHSYIRAHQRAGGRSIIKELFYFADVTQQPEVFLLDSGQNQGLI